MSKLTTIKECLIYADFIDKPISESTIRRLISNNEIVSIKENKKVYIDKYSFIEYLENKKTKKGKKSYKTKESKEEQNINEELYISLDWFQCTFYAKKKNYFNVDELKNILIDLLYIKETDIEILNKRYNNYQKALEYSGILLMYGDDTYNHCNLQIKGEGCSILYKRLIENGENWYSFLEKIYQRKGKITRMDIAIDDYKPIFELEELEEKLVKREFTSKFKNFKYLKDDKMGENMGMTIYLGSNTSNVYFRFYKKGAEREAKSGEKSIDYNRYEIVLKDEKANSVLKKIHLGETLENIGISLINKYITVYENLELSEYWSKWKKLILGSKNFNFDIQRKEKSIERTKSWLKSSVATALDKVMIADSKAIENNLLPKNYNTLDDILSYSNLKNNDREQEEINRYISSKEKIKNEKDLF